ncbi:hypothetical protein RDABS01_035868 [Bienertia sinuspersici]
MLKTPPKRNHNTTYCALTTTFLLLLSLFLLHTRLSSHRRTSSNLLNNAATTPFTVDDLLLQDSDSDSDSDAKTITTHFDDRVDELDIIAADDDSKLSNNEDAVLRSLDSDAEDSNDHHSTVSSGFYFDHVSRVFRRQLDFQSVDDDQLWSDYATPFLAFNDDKSKVAFGSDDVPVDEEMRGLLVRVNGIEDALLLKLGTKFSPLREGWGSWFDAKSDFLKKDRMFKSKLELFNPVTNPLLQDPDGFGFTALTRGDKIVQKGLLHEMKKALFTVKEPVDFSDINSGEAIINHVTKERSSINESSLGRGNAEQRFHVDQETEVRSENRTLDYEKFTVLGGSATKGVYARSLRRNAGDVGFSLGNIGEGETQIAKTPMAHNKPEFTGSLYADGTKWGYFPGLNPRLSFSNFMDSFLRKSKCSMRVFMVWNSPPWMYTVRYQRGLESLLFHHPDACVVVFSETIELDFFKEFLKAGFKIAVTMPNLEELLKDTPTSIFASVWNEWRMTRYYSTHYSELMRLAALYKYGGIYLDCDIITLKPISMFNNSMGTEDLADGSPLNGAFMAFDKHSFFILQCLFEFFPRMMTPC